MEDKKIIIYTDGGARGNPGPAGIGVVLMNDDGFVIDRKSEYIGEQTNNQAEYHALILGLTEGKNRGAREMHCYLDSELVVKQMQGEYKVKNVNVKPLHTIASSLAKDFDKIVFTHIPREENKKADALVNEALDKELEE